MQVTWIKLSLNIFDDEKIKLIETMPDKDAIIVIWIKLLCQAGKCADGGSVYMAPERPYSDEELAAIFNRPLNTIRLALKTFQSLRMIELREDDSLYLPNFIKHQNCERMEELREMNRTRVQRFREKQKELPAPCNALQPITCNDKRREDKIRIREDKIRVPVPPYSPPALQENDATTTTVSDELRTLIDVYVNNIGQLTPLIENELAEIETKYPAGWFEEAVKEAAKNNSRRLKYVTAILDRWLVDGFKVDKKNGHGAAPADDSEKYTRGRLAHLVQR